MTHTALFGAALLLALLLCRRAGMPSLTRTAWALIANCLCALVAIWIWGATPWRALFVIDAVTAYVVLRHPARMAQAAIGGMLACQVLAHLSFGWVGLSAGANYYLVSLNLIGWLQVATLSGGAIYGGGRKAYLGNCRLFDSRQAAAHVASRVEGGG